MSSNLSEEIKKQVNLILKLQKQAKSEFNLGNEGAAELFFDKAESLLAKFNLNQKVIDDYSNELETKNVIITNEMGSSIVINPYIRVNTRKSKKLIWWEKLAELVSKHYNCYSVNRSFDGSVSIYGLESDRDSAICMFESIAAVSNNICKIKFKEVFDSVGKFDRKKKNLSEWCGDDVFIDSFHYGFRLGLQSLYDEQKHIHYDFDNELNYTKSKNYANENSNLDQAPWNYDWRLRAEESKIIEQNTCQLVIDIGKEFGKMALIKATKKTNALATTIKTESLNQECFILIDTSGSMSSGENVFNPEIEKEEYINLLTQAKRGAIQFAKTAKDKNINIGLINFDSRARLVFKPQEFNQDCENQINSLYIGGSTNMSEAIKIAMTQFRGKKYKKTICIVTDGMPNNLEYTYQIATEAKRMGIEIMIIGCGGCTQEFINRMQSRSGLGMLVSNNRLMLGVGDMAKNLNNEDTVKSGLGGIQL